MSDTKIKIQLDENRVLFPFESNNGRGIILYNETTKQSVKVAFTLGIENDGRFLTFYDKATNRQFFVYPNSSEIYEINVLPTGLLFKSRFTKTKDIEGIITKVLESNDNIQHEI